MNGHSFFNEVFLLNALKGQLLARKEVFEQ
jgi:hypothetical protein